MFDLARFIAECEAAIVTDGHRNAVREVLTAAISDPAGIISALGEPRRAGDKVLHRSPRLTILHIVWPPSFTQTPHNHLLWAEIGVYSGREDNIFGAAERPILNGRSKQLAPRRYALEAACRLNKTSFTPLQIRSIRLQLVCTSMVGT
jgi:predicted metal-dependent enzyme (double-stranded beta helix superfamily)